MYPVLFKNLCRIFIQSSHRFHRLFKGFFRHCSHTGKCYELIEKKFGREYADQLLVNHPAKILTGEMK
jgi:hypothetical protein